MGNISQNNKRIAQNTFLLYVRMFITLTVSLYTSRIVLEKLGVEDYGIYNVVAGLVSMFTFMNGTLATGTQRFITFSLGENNFKKLKLTFSTTLIIHIILSLIIGIVIFVGGLYFLKEELVISADRMEAAYWVFYCSVLTVMLNITQVPYMASIIAHEDMSIYAYMSIFDAVAKLSVAFALVIVDVDKMKLYAVLIALVQVCDVFYYRYHCIRKYKECHFEVRFDKSLAKEILQFSSWNIFGCTSVLFNNQGFNILLNIFYGPVLNAARGISNQVNNVASQFVGSFQTAVNPQIVKYYAEKDIERMNRLIYHNARFSGLMILYIMVPLMIELPFLLSLWLGKYPDDTVFLTRIILVQTLITSMSRSVVMGIHAIGKMKMVNLLAGTTLLLSLPVSFVLLKLSISLEIVMIVTLLPWFIETFIELTLMKKYVGLSRRKFYIQSYGTIILIGGIMFTPLLVISNYMNEGYIRFLVNMSISTVLGGILIYCFGITANMRMTINDKIKSLTNK